MRLGGPGAGRLRRRRAGGRTAVYAGRGLNTYLLQNLLPNRELLASAGELQAILLNNNDFLTTRISYRLDLKGPSALVQTACSTGLVAVHMACQACSPGSVTWRSPARSRSPCRSSPATLPGGERDVRRRPLPRLRRPSRRRRRGGGAGMVVLKRLAEAVADGDYVHAVIRGSAVNNDGGARVGFTAPASPARRR